MTTSNDFSGGTFAGPVITGGEFHGDVDSHARMQVPAPDLPALLAALRSELATRPSDVDVLGDLTALEADVAARQGGHAVDAGAARGRWRRVSAALDGVQLAANLAQLGEGVARLFGAG